ncbi:response regulator [Sulfitobacter sp. KE34]|mgnify:FL=1|uniref:Response regulator n=3 Tax=Sulfitobacter TaxID=60136 RepID=A0AAX3LS35_9RHOB|nr:MULTISPECIES: response regulator [Sulfitobacter]MDF3350928.1 response regulator [Sulfitobacter sp. KE12]MDF3354600.1 response regulator [Sulfitobacter sp. KE27]MDF3358248.1 response regulator [Sulfitobacter sp. KE33]MDF3365672.1 response regulator [Sulfitobacter sp. Ks34]MDF3369391.1 response regulator [Sulfitobacter sp. Ks43]
MSPRIIAVDDSDIAQDFISATLSELGFDDVVSFIDPRSALDAIESDEATADLILMDIMMPDIDGIELCARIRALDRWSDVPIIMLTSRTDMGSLSEAFMAGANDYVTKPFNRIELQARMRSCLRLKSELDRRRLGENRSARRRAAPGVSEATVPSLLGSKSGFQGHLMSLSPAMQKNLGLIVFRIDGDRDQSDAARAQRQELQRRVAGLFGKVEIPAQDGFAHWEDDLFVYGALHADRAQLEARAQQFISAVAEASATVKEGWTSRPLSVSACVVPPSDAAVATSLARGIQGVESAGITSAPGSICLATKDIGHQAENGQH